ncbi:MAG: SHOCT domain-containing protein [Rhodocyclaceae bacterium]|nr:SHOCT domain-containing protein [Rhodocyclaceae bacterium]
MWGDYGMGWTWGIFGIIHMVLWWILLIVGIVVLVQWLRTGRAEGGRGAASHALEILEERYARGEIEKAEFDAKRRDLKR